MKSILAGVVVTVVLSVVAAWVLNDGLDYTASEREAADTVRLD